MTRTMAALNAALTLLAAVMIVYGRIHSGQVVTQVNIRSIYGDLVMVLGLELLVVCLLWWGVILSLLNQPDPRRIFGRAMNVFVYSQMLILPIMLAELFFMMEDKDAARMSGILPPFFSMLAMLMTVLGAVNFVMTALSFQPVHARQREWERNVLSTPEDRDVPQLWPEQKADPDDPRE